MNSSSLTPTPQKTAPVHEYHCTFTHDIKRKNAKRWKDGFLKFHTFNNRMLVYDESRNFVQAGHQISGAGDVFDGAELTLDLILVQVGEPMGVTQTDLSEVVKKKSPQRASASKIRPKPRVLHRSPTQRPTTSLRSVIASSASGISQTPDFHDSFRNSHPAERPSKRPRRDDNHKPLREMLNSNNKIPTPLPPAHFLPRASERASPPRTVQSRPKASKERQKTTVDLISDLSPVPARVSSTKSSSTGTNKATRVSNKSDSEIADASLALDRRTYLQRNTASDKSKTPARSSTPRRANNSAATASDQHRTDRRIHVIYSQSSDDEDNVVEERHVFNGLDFHVSNDAEPQSKPHGHSPKAPPKRISRPKFRQEERLRDDQPTSQSRPTPSLDQNHSKEGKGPDASNETQAAEPQVTEQKKTKALRLKSRPQRRMLCQALEPPALPPEAPTTTRKKTSNDVVLPTDHTKPVEPEKSPVVETEESMAVDKTIEKAPANPQTASQRKEEDLFSLFVADDFAQESQDATKAAAASKSQSTPASDSGNVLVVGSQGAADQSSTQSSSGKTVTVDPRSLSLHQPEGQEMVVASSQQSEQAVAAALLEAELDQLGEAMDVDASGDAASASAAPAVAAPQQQVERPDSHMQEVEQTGEGDEQEKEQGPPAQEKGPWTSEAWDLFGWCPPAYYERLGWRRYEASGSCAPA